MTYPLLGHLTFERLEADKVADKLFGDEADNRMMFDVFAKSKPRKDAGVKMRTSNTCWYVGHLGRDNGNSAFGAGKFPLKFPKKLYMNPGDWSDDAPEWGYSLANIPIMRSGTMTIGSLAGSPAKITWYAMQAKYLNLHLNEYDGKFEQSSDWALGQFGNKMNPAGGDREGRNLYFANMHMAVVTVDLIKGSHRLRACGSVLYSMNLDDKTGEDEKKNTAAAVQLVLATCPFLDIGRTITGGPPYKDVHQQQLDEERKMRL